MFRWTYIILIFCVLVIVMGQFLFKIAASNLRFNAENSAIQTISVNIRPILYVLTAISLYIVSTMLWVFALRTVPLSTAYMFNALAFILVPLGGFLLFAEPMPRLFIVGSLFIGFGLLLISLSS
jgi:multidrug transporter EmrE-like cation transporter